MKDNFYGYYSNVFMTKMRLMVKVVVLPHVVLARLLFYFMTLYDMCGGVVAGVHSSLALFCGILSLFTTSCKKEMAV